MNGVNMKKAAKHGGPSGRGHRTARSHILRYVEVFLSYDVLY